MVQFLTAHYKEGRIWYDMSKFRTRLCHYHTVDQTAVRQTPQGNLKVV
jgi:hypothetical protein